VQIVSLSPSGKEAKETIDSKQKKKKKKKKLFLAFSPYQ
jgi:hypothetical protein